MVQKNKNCSASALVLLCMSLMFATAGNASMVEDTLAYWRFEQVRHLNRDISTAIIGKPLTADDRRPTDPQPFIFDNSGKGNFLQVRGSRASPNVFSDNVPAREGTDDRKKIV